MRGQLEENTLLLYKGVAHMRKVTWPFSSETGDHSQIYFIGMQPDTQANSGSYVALSSIWNEYQLKCGESVPGKWRQLSLWIKHIVWQVS